MTATLSTEQSQHVDDRCVVVQDPRPGTVVELAAGAHLGIRFRRRLGASTWHVAQLPGHLVQLAGDGHELVFLVFGTTDAPAPLRLERRHPDRGIVHEVCEVLVVSSVGVRTSRSA
jgi:hypothetical protein